MEVKGREETCKYIECLYRYSNHEAWMIISLYIFYGVWWWSFFYFSEDSNPLSYSYLCGFPSWFFYSCIIGYPLICILLQLVVFINFKDINLDIKEHQVSSNESDKIFKHDKIPLDLQ